MRNTAVGVHIQKMMGIRIEGVTIAPFYWRDSTDGTYRAPRPNEKVVWVRWDDGTKGWIHISHVRQVKATR